MWKVSPKSQTTLKQEEQNYGEVSRQSDLRTTQAYLEPEVVSQESHVGDVTDLKVSQHWLATNKGGIKEIFTITFVINTVFSADFEEVVGVTTCQE